MSHLDPYCCCTGYVLEKVEIKVHQHTFGDLQTDSAYLETVFLNQDFLPASLPLKWQQRGRLNQDHKKRRIREKIANTLILCQ